MWFIQAGYEEGTDRKLDINNQDPRISILYVDIFGGSINGLAVNISKR